LLLPAVCRTHVIMNLVNYVTELTTSLLVAQWLKQYPTNVGKVLDSTPIGD